MLNKAIATDVTYLEKLERRAGVVWLSDRIVNGGITTSQFFYQVDR
jgi:hypothetical protein